MSSILTVDCSCGGSFSCSEYDLKKSLSGVKTCGNLIGALGNYTRCDKKYSYLKLLKILQITNYWNVNDEQTEARAESSTV